MGVVDGLEQLARLAAEQDRGERSTNQTPSGKSASTTPARRSARRVLPAPPDPVSVSSRASASSPAARATSGSRPTNRVRGVGSLVDRVATAGVLRVSHVEDDL